MSGEFLQQFFEAKGFTDIKSNGEIDVLCPFPHDKGYETRPSANVNVDEGIFHCFTCEAEGRFSKGGLSEAGFVKEVYGMSYTEAIQFISSQKKDFNADESHQKFVELLLNTEEKVQYLLNRGIDREDIEKYQLAYDGATIIYPIYVNGVMLDRRHYNTTREGNEAKIKSEKDAKPLLFPYDHWIEQLDCSDFTLLTAGENDTILARKYGYNAVESTMGEGSFPKIFINLFKGKKVIICYDCDEAGRSAARRTAFKLKEAGADVHIMDLGLEGSKESKDITDFFIHHKYSKDDFNEKISLAIPFNEDDLLEVKNEVYPLVDLWDIPKGKHANKRLSTRAIMMGKFSIPMETPAAIQAVCTHADEENINCKMCPFNKENERWWVLNDDTLKDVLELVELNKPQQDKVIKRLMKIPEKCPRRPRITIRERKSVTKVIFAPDVDMENELAGFKAAEMYAYVIEEDGKDALEDGSRYRVFFKRFAHPNDKQKIVMVVDKTENSDNSINAFKVTPEILEELSTLQMTPQEAEKHRHEIAREVVGTFIHPMVVKSVNIMFHSPIEFKIYGNYTKGYPESLIVGPSRTGKTKTAQRLEFFYGVGNFTTVKNATTAGLLGGADKLPSGEFKISWGKIPLNHRGLLILDEMSGLSKDVMSTLTDMRSEGMASIEKIKHGKAPAKTRLLWISNPRTNSDGNSRSIEEYPNGVKVILDLVGSDEDIARFDFCYILPNTKEYIAPVFDDEREKEELGKIQALDNSRYHHLIQWAWSRKADQVKFDRQVDRYIWHMSKKLNEKYDSEVKFFGAEAAYKIARIAVSSAIMCFSHDGTGESILVKKEHVDWAVQFMIDCYDNDIFRLPEYAEQAKFTTETNEEVNNVFASLVNAQPMIMKSLSNQTESSLRMLEAVAGLDRKDFNPVISNLVRNGLITVSRDTVMATKRFREALRAYRENIDGHRMRPLSEQSGNFI
jgi:DNA-binding MarR family transcriptional regulator